MKELNVQKLLRTYKSIGIISLSSILGAIITFISLPFLTRLYSLQDFAIYGLAISIVSICSVATMLRLEQALLIITDRVEVHKLAFECIIISSIIVLILGLFFQLNFSPSFVLCVVSGILANNFVQVIYNINFSFEKEWTCAAINFFRTVGVVLMQLILPSFYSVELIYVYTLSSIFWVVFSIIYLLSLGYLKISFSSFLSYKDFIFANMPHAFLNSFSHNLPYYAINIFLNSQILGFYMLAERVLKAPIGLFSQTIRMFYIRKFRVENGNKIALKHSLVMSIISLPFFASFILIPDGFYIFIFGSEWAGVSEIFSILALGYWAIFCNPPSSAFLIAKRKSKTLLELQIFELIIKIGLFLIFYFYLGSNAFVLLSVALSLCIYNFMILYRVNRENV